MDAPSLKRTLSFWFTLAYGLGTILGAGVYVLIGKVAGYAGFFTPLAFILASVVAAFTAYSYSRLCARYPKAAGEATYIQEAFGKRWLTALVGWLVVITGVVSAAALSRGFIGYFQVFLNVPDAMILICLILIIGLLACWGIGQSVNVVIIITLIEIAGLISVISVAFFQHAQFSNLSIYIGMPKGGEWLGVSLGAFLAFYAFIGFEDMVNLAEEVKEPNKTLPIAIFVALGVAMLLYALSALAAISAIPIDELIESDAPFALLFQKQGLSPGLITFISLVSIINGILVQVIMAARVMYGMGKQGTAPSILSHIHCSTQTPILATILASMLIFILAFWFPVVTLAQITSFVILFVFALVNLALVAMSIGFASKVLPSIGFIFCLLLLGGRFFIL